MPTLRESRPWPTVSESKLRPVPPTDAYIYELHQGGILGAEVSGTEQDRVLRTVLALVGRYEADGPVDLYRVLRVKVILVEDVI